MTGSEIEFLKDHIDKQFDEAKDWRKDVTAELSDLKREIPKIAREKAQEVIATTAFIKPVEKVIVGISLVTVILTAFGSYGKIASMMDRFERLETKIEASKVVEHSNWLNDHKGRLEDNEFKMQRQLLKMQSQLERMQGELQTVQNKFYK